MALSLGIHVFSSAFYCQSALETLENHCCFYLCIFIAEFEIEKKAISISKKMEIETLKPTYISEFSTQIILLFSVTSSVTTRNFRFLATITILYQAHAFTAIQLLLPSFLFSTHCLLSLSSENQWLKSETTFSALKKKSFQAPNI